MSTVDIIHLHPVLKLTVGTVEDSTKVKPFIIFTAILICLYLSDNSHITEISIASESRPPSESMSVPLLRS